MVFLLLLLTIFVWGAIIIKIRAEIKNLSVPSSQLGTIYPTMSPDAGARIGDLVLLDSLEKIPDPFSYNSPEMKIQNQQLDLARNKLDDTIAAPCFKFTGLLCDRDGKVAIIEISPNDIQFIREGQIVEGFELDEILSKELRFKYKGEKFSISANF
jgi:hypothetical protein